MYSVCIEIICFAHLCRADPDICLGKCVEYKL